VLKDEFVKRSLEPTDLKLAGKVGLITAILAFDKSLGPDLRNELLVIVQGRLVKSARMSAIGRTAFSTSHDMRHSLSAIYANAEFLGSHDTRVPGLHTRQAKNESQDVHHNSDLLSFRIGRGACQSAPYSPNLPWHSIGEQAVNRDAVRCANEGSPSTCPQPILWRIWSH
jgi:hypothetical protein